MFFRNKRKYAKRRGANRRYKRRVSRFKKVARLVTQTKETHFKGRQIAYNTLSDYVAVCLTDLVNYTNIFGSEPEDFEGNRILHKTCQIQNRVSLENDINSEEDTIGFSYYVVSLKKHATQIFNPATTQLNLVAGTHYYQLGGRTILNPLFFNIKRQRHFVLSNYNEVLSVSAGQTQYGTDRNWNDKITMNVSAINPGGDVADLATYISPSKTYYAILFSDNSIVDLESPLWKANIVNTYEKL